jgi:hypothetical protein
LAHGEADDGVDLMQLGSGPSLMPAEERHGRLLAAREGGGTTMATMPHQPSSVMRERPSWSLRLLVSEMWASLAIIVIWLAVLFDAIYGPNIVNTSPGGNTSSVPSAVPVALFAFLATWPVAKYGFRNRREE